MKYSFYLFKEFPVNLKKLNENYPYSIPTKDDNKFYFSKFLNTCPVSLDILNKIYDYLLLEMWYVNDITDIYFVDDWLNKHPEINKHEIITWLESFNIYSNEDFINKLGVFLTDYLDNIFED